MTASMSPQDITGLVLAGGRGSRMGGVDKGLQLLDGVPLAQRVLQRLQPQVGRVVINANRHLEVYRSLGAPVWPDSPTAADDMNDADGLPRALPFAGPLSGFLAGLTRCQTPWLVTVPCDAPRFPADLVIRLVDALRSGLPDRARLAMAVAAGRPQPVFCLMHVSLRESLVRFTRSGGSKVRAWAEQEGCTMVAFDRITDAPDAFMNINTLAELAAIDSLPAST